LVYLANQAVITPHACLCRADEPDHPDQMIFDLDPPDGTFAIVRRTALKLRDVLEKHGLTSFVKTTGSRGLHVLVPLKRDGTFASVHDFAMQIATQIEKEDPQHLTTEVRKDKRNGRVFIDTARNGYAQTAVPPYAVRPRDGAPIAAPLSWDEVSNPRLRSDQFTIRNIFDRLDQMGDLWKDVEKHARAIGA
jgi:bifunctional non-homologous end joining protein LigD